MISIIAEAGLTPWKPTRNLLYTRRSNSTNLVTTLILARIAGSSKSFERVPKGQFCYLFLCWNHGRSKACARLVFSRFNLVPYLCSFRGSCKTHFCNRVGAHEKPACVCAGIPRLAFTISKSLFFFSCYTDWLPLDRAQSFYFQFML